MRSTPLLPNRLLKQHNTPPENNISDSESRTDTQPHSDTTVSALIGFNLINPPRVPEQRGSGTNSRHHRSNPKEPKLTASHPNKPATQAVQHASDTQTHDQQTGRLRNKQSLQPSPCGVAVRAHSHSRSSDICGRAASDRARGRTPELAACSSSGGAGGPGITAQPLSPAGASVPIHTPCECVTDVQVSRWRQTHRLVQEQRGRESEQTREGRKDK